MAVPQPEIIGSKQNYQQLQNQKSQGLTQAAGTFAQTMAENRRLAEEQRQFDLRKSLDVADSIRKSQYGGNWVRFAQDNQGLAKNIMYELYGPQDGEEMYKQLTTAKDNQTAEQIIDNVRRQALKVGGGAGGGGGSTQPVPTTPVRDEQQPKPQDQGQGRTSMDLTPGVPEQVERASGGPQAMNLAGPAQTEKGPGVEAPNVSPRSGAPAKKVDVEGRQQERPEAQKWESDYATETAGVQIGEGGMLVNQQGLPVARGQEQAEFPVNTMTLGTFSETLPNPDEVGAGETARGIAKQFGQRGASEEAQQFIRQGTAQLRGADKDSEEWKEFDRKAQKYLGVDGDTWFSIRNQMFDNAQKGRPLGYIPPEEERTQWWWTGQEMPVAERAQRTIGDKGAGFDEKADVAKEIKQTDVGQLSLDDMNKIGNYLNNAADEMVQSIASEESVAKDVVKKIGLPESASSDFQEWADAFLKARGRGGVQKATTEHPKGARVAERVLERGSNAARKAKARSRGRSEQQKEKDREAVAEGDFTFEQRVGVTRERAEQILQQMEGPASEREWAVRTSVPLEERQFEEAKRQFNEQLAFEREQAPTEEERKARTQQMKAQARLMSAKAAMAELEADLTQEQYEAMQNGEAPKDLTVAYKFAKEIYTRYMEDIHDDCDSQDCVSRQLKEALKNKQFKNAYDTVMQLNSAISGVPVEQVAAQFRERGFFKSFFGAKGSRTAEETITGFATGGSGGTPRRGAPAATVTSGGGAGEQQEPSAGAQLGSGYIR